VVFTDVAGDVIGWRAGGATDGVTNATMALAAE
jgi:hypothetical protein